MQVVSTFHLSAYDTRGKGAGVLYVLAADDNGMHKVYSGIVHINPSRANYGRQREIFAERIAVMGNPEPIGVAQARFSGINPATYRK